MKGEAQVIERLNEALFLELGAVNQYWVHFRLLDDWGYKKLASKERAESIEEMHHADRLIERIIFLEGHPNLQRVAPTAAGVIHSDFEKGFIRAEVTAYDDFIRHHGEQGAKEAGKLRLEGKDYVVQDGDVMHFRFNV